MNHEPASVILTIGKCIFYAFPFSGRQKSSCDRCQYCPYLKALGLSHDTKKQFSDITRSATTSEELVGEELDGKAVRLVTVSGKFGDADYVV